MFKMSSSSISCSSILLATLVACADRPASDTVDPRHDIIGHTAPTPESMMGELDGDTDVTFSDISGILRLPNGSIVIANRYSPPTLHFFTSTGARLRSVGRAGEGPGEFKSISWIQLVGDTLVVYDPSLARISRFSFGGDFLSSRQLPAGRFGSSGPLWLTGLLEDGSGLAQPQFSFPAGGRGSGRSHLYLSRVDLTTGQPTQLLQVPGAEYGPRPQTSHSMGVVFGKSTAVELINNRIFVATGDSLSVVEYDPQGREIRAFIAPYKQRTVAKADIDAEYERIIGTISAGDREMARREVRQIRKDAPTSSRFPATGDYGYGTPGPSIHVDSEGRLWLLEYLAPRDTTAYWAVFKRSGTYLGRVAVPATFWIHDVQSDVAYGVQANSDGVESVRSYRVLWRN